MAILSTSGSSEITTTSNFLFPKIKIFYTKKRIFDNANVTETLS